MPESPTPREARLAAALEEIRRAAAEGIKGGHFLRPDWIIRRVDRALDEKGGAEARLSGGVPPQEAELRRAVEALLRELTGLRPGLDRAHFHHGVQREKVDDAIRIGRRALELGGA